MFPNERDDRKEPPLLTKTRTLDSVAVQSGLSHERIGLVSPSCYAHENEIVFVLRQSLSNGLFFLAAGSSIS